VAKRVLVTRAAHQASALAEALRALGLDPILIPTIELTEPTTFAPLDAAIAALLGPATSQVPQGFSLGSHHHQEEGVGALAPAFHWLLFTSANAVEAFAYRLQHLKSVILSEATEHSDGAQSKDPDAARTAPTLEPLPTTPRPTPLSSILCPIAAIGPATARAISQLLGTEPTLTAPTPIAESLAEALLPYATQPDGTPTRFLLVRAQFVEEKLARDHLPDTLRAAGADVTVVPAYRTVLPQDSIAQIRSLFHSPTTIPDAITFTSSSTATNLLALLEAAALTLPPEILRISIGPITSQTLRDLHLPPHAESPEPTVSSLAQTVVKALNHRLLL
jgi:uroporphyrinogen-III synthase